MTLIKLEEISKLYGLGDATTIALDGIDLSIEKGEFIAVMGPSGSGKSTLMNIIGLLDRPTHGRYSLSGRSVARLRSTQRARARRDSIGFVFQSFNLLPKLNVLDNVSLPLAYKAVSRTKRHERAADILERVGLGDRQYYLPRQLSGGQIQRAAIARALVNDPSIIIADEPTGNLDSSASRLIMELLGEIHKDGATILLVTHNPELTRWASRVVYMHDGEIVHDETTPLGEIAKTAQRTVVFVPKITEEDKLAGISALMKAIPKATSGRRKKSHKAGKKSYKAPAQKAKRSSR